MSPLHPVVDLAQLGQQRLDDFGVALGEGLGRQIELMVGDDALAIGERARAGRRLGRSLERIPDRPGIDRALLEGGAGIGRREERRLDVGIVDAGLLQRLHQQVMDVRALVERDLLALEIGDGLDRAVLGHEDRLARGRGRLMRDIDERRAGGLREDRRRFAGIAEIDGADIDRFEQLRPGGELRPGHLEAERLQLLLQRALGS